MSPLAARKLIDSDWQQGHQAETALGSCGKLSRRIGLHQKNFGYPKFSRHQDSSSPSILRQFGDQVFGQLRTATDRDRQSAIDQARQNHAEKYAEAYTGFLRAQECHYKTKLDQLSLPIRQAVLGNVGTLITFRIGHSDAEVMAILTATRY
jgi:hypothetical protein